MGRVKRILLTTLIGIGALCIINAPVNATGKPELQAKIESTINTALDEYLASIDVNTEVNKLIDDTLAGYITDMIDSETETAFETAIKQEAENTLMQYFGDTPKTIGTEPVTGLQTIFENAIRDSVYNSNPQIKEKVKEIVLNNLSSKISTYNTNMKTLYRQLYTDYYDDEYGNPTTIIKNRYWGYTTVNGQPVYMSYLISDAEKTRILTAVEHQLDLIINIGYSVKNNALTGTSGSMTFSQTATEYIKANILKYTDTKALLARVRNDVKITVGNDLKQKIVSSIRDYIVSEAGQSIFKGIKNAIYYNIQENGGLDKVYNEGFGDETASYISGEIGEIVNKNIKLALAPYIKQLSETEISKVTNTITQEYVNNGSWQVIIDSINANIDEMLKLYPTSTGESEIYYGANRLRHNLGTALSSYLANTSIPTIINTNLTAIKGGTKYKPTTTATDYVPWTINEDENGREITWDNSYNGYSSIGHLILAEVKNSAANYMETTIFDKVKTEAKATVNTYLTGENKAELGDIIKNTFTNKVNEVFNLEVVEPLLDNINTAISNWISVGIGTKVTNELQKTVTEYLSTITDADEFSQETGIKLGEIIKQVKNSNPGNDGQISLEDLIANKYLVGVEKGRIVVPVESATHPLDDATVELGTILMTKTVVKELNAGNMILENPYWAALTFTLRFFTNPYGSSVSIGIEIGIAGLSRTIADYDIDGIRNLTPAEAYVLAHDKHTSYYPDRTQNAYYSVLQWENKMTPEDDEGIVDKDTYRTFQKIFGYISLAQNINWKDMFNQLKAAQSLSQMIMSVDPALISAAFNIAGISMYDLLPFVDPTILSIASMCGLGIGNIARFLQVGVASFVGWIETGGNSFMTSTDPIRVAATNAYNKVTNVGNEVWGAITGVKDWLTGASDTLEDEIATLEAQANKQTAEARQLESDMNDIDNRLATETNMDTINSLNNSKAHLLAQFYAKTAELNETNIRINELNAQYATTMADAASKVSEQLKQELGSNYNKGGAQISEDLNSRFGLSDSLNRGDNSALLEELSKNPLDNNTTPSTVLELAEANTAAALSQTHNIQQEVAKNIEYFDTSSLSQNEEYANLSQDSQILEDFNNIVYKSQDQIIDKSASEAIAIIQENWEKDPSYDPIKSPAFTEAVAEQINVKPVTKGAINVAENNKMSWNDLKDGIKSIGGTISNVASSAFNMGFVRSTFLNILQGLIPMPNEVTDDYSEEEPIAALELADEAINFQKAVEHWDDFEAKHYGKNFVDLTDYNNVKVSYSKISDYIYVGPFTVDYVREVYDPVSLYDSEVADYETGNISFSGIVAAELYADDAKTVKIEDWEFVYPDKERSILESYDRDYEYPYPGETFFLKLPSQENYSVNTLSRMTFRLARMNADGQVYELSGNYQQLLWMTTGIRIPCIWSGACAHGFIGGAACPVTAALMAEPLAGPKNCMQLQISPTGTWCPWHTLPAVEEAEKQTVKELLEDSIEQKLISSSGPIGESAITAITTVATSKDLMKIQKWPALSGHNMGNHYFCFRVTLGTGHAQDLEEIIYSKIYREYQMEEMEFGVSYNERESNAQKKAVYNTVKQTYHSTSINESNILYNQLHQGNLSINTDGVPNLPFMDNYDSGEKELNYAYFNYPDYPDNPNYPDSPYYPDNTNYPDYPSYPYYAGDPRYPYYNGNNTSTRVKELDNPVIPLTFHIEGNVWLDNPTGYEAEADGVWDEGHERGIPNVEVILYKEEDPDNYIARTLTDEKGHYEFEYVRVGFDYYVEFLYDGITYKSTKYLGSDIKEYTGETQTVKDTNENYRANPEAYLDCSHAMENTEERDDFNAKFYHISQNLATANPNVVGTEISYLSNAYHVTTVDETIPMEYQTWYTTNGAISTLITTDSRGITLDDYKMSARTNTTGLYFPLNDQYQVDYDDLYLYEDNSDLYIRTYPGLEHVNLGLVLREQGDMAVKTDLYQIKTVDKDGILKAYDYNEKEISDELYDIISRNPGYYNNVPYEQEIDPNDHSWKIDATELYQDVDLVTSTLSLDQELNIYLEYKIMIKNNGTLHSGRVIKLENSFTDDLEYDLSYYGLPVYGKNADGLDISSSWIEVPLDGSEETTRQTIEWKYRAGMENNYYTIWTDDLAERNITPGEEIELHLVLKVKKTDSRDNVLDNDGNENNGGNTGDPSGGNNGNGGGDNNNNGTDNGRDIKTSITEIHTYSYDEGLITKSANPGSMNIGFSRTYPDSADPAPLLKIVIDRDYQHGNEITGYVWEDYATIMKSDNNQLIGNGVWEQGEPLIDGVKVELIEVIKNPDTGVEIEVLRKTASGTDYYYTGEDIVVNGETLKVNQGQYRFTDLEAGTYKVKFTYGDTYQLSQDLTYNAQDFKTLALDTIYQQYDNKQLEVMILNDTSAGMLVDYKGSKMNTAVQSMIDNLYNTVQMAKVGVISFSEPAGNEGLSVGLTQKGTNNTGRELVKSIIAQNAVNRGPVLSDALAQATSQFSSNADAKVILILTDGHMQNQAADKAALQAAAAAGIKVITITCSTDEWDNAVFGEIETPTAGNLYSINEKNIDWYINRVALEDILLEFESTLPNLTDAKDVETVYTVPNRSNVGEVYSRERNINYSSTMTNENSEVLELENIRTLQAQLNDNSVTNKDAIRNEINERIATLANNTKVTAITPAKNILFTHDNNRTSEVNLGLVERPKLDVRLHEEISRIVITLANGQVIIDTARDLTQNVTPYPEQTVIAMDEEIMQGAKIDVDYILTITNNGQVDTLADYFTYDMFDADAVAYMTRTVPVKIGALNNYYTNLTFRAEDNTNLEVETNSITVANQDRVLSRESTLVEREELTGRAIGNTITPYISDTTTNRSEDGRAIVLQETVTWENKQMIKLKDEVSASINNREIKAVETTSLRNTELFPNISKEVLAGNAAMTNGAQTAGDLKFSSINIYVRYTKNIAANDPDDSLLYDNSTEIVERLSDVGRRIYLEKTGDYVPHSEVSQQDSAKADRITILPPFGEDHSTNYYLIVLASATILGVGIVFIRKKVL